MQPLGVVRHKLQLCLDLTFNLSLYPNYTVRMGD